MCLALTFNQIVATSEKEPVKEDVGEDTIINEESPQDILKNQNEQNENIITSSPFVKTNVLFIQPVNTNLPAGRVVKLLVGFHNNGSNNFIIDSIDGSFRYPQDFSYSIQNFSVFEYRKIIESDREATFEYSFIPSETFSSRQFGLTINLRYRNFDGKLFINSVFNETINVVEPDEGFDGETFLLYIFLAAIVVLLVVGLQQFFTVFKKKTGIRSKPTYNVQKVSNGNASTNTEDVDYEWIPKEHLQTNKSPKVSPRQRKVNGQANGNTLSASGNSSNDE